AARLRRGRLGGLRALVLAPPVRRVGMRDRLEPLGAYLRCLSRDRHQGCVATAPAERKPRLPLKGQVGPAAGEITHSRPAVSVPGQTPCSEVLRMCADFDRRARQARSSSYAGMEGVVSGPGEGARYDRGDRGV